VVTLLPCNWVVYIPIQYVGGLVTFEQGSYLGFEVITAVTMTNAVFWDVEPCEFNTNRRFG
jgi:hypothetical protein